MPGGRRDTEASDDRLPGDRPGDRSGPGGVPGHDRPGVRGGPRRGGRRVRRVAAVDRGGPGSGAGPGGRAVPRAGRRARRAMPPRRWASHTGPRWGSWRSSRTSSTSTPRGRRAISGTRSSAPASGGRAVLQKRPVGVLLGIMPWNYPYYQVARFVAPNLVLGNTIVLKHAPSCPRSALAVARLLADAGVPAGGYGNLFASNDQIATIDRRPPAPGRLPDGERAGGLGGRRDRGKAPEEGGAGAGRIGPVPAPGLRRRRGERDHRLPGPDGQPRTGLQLAQADDRRR